MLLLYLIKTRPYKATFHCMKLKLQESLMRMIYYDSNKNLTQEIK